MIRQRRGFLTFIFSLFPGAGEMYMGFFKQGISIMLAFFGIIAIASLSGLSATAILVPVIWFYSFFHVHNLGSMPFEVFQTMEDHYLFIESDDQLKATMQSQKARKILAIVLIVIGAASLWDVFTDLLYAMLPGFALETVSTISHTVPQILIALLIIYLGVILIKGKKKELDDMPEDTFQMNQDRVVVDSEIIKRQVVEGKEETENQATAGTAEEVK